MPSEMLKGLLNKAKIDVQGKIAKYGGDTQLSTDYKKFHQEIFLEVWQDRSEGDYRVTYDAVLDMIVGLQKNVERLNNVECVVSVSPVVGATSRPSGVGTVRFGRHPQTNRSGMVSSSSNETKETITYLGADRWEYRVPNTATAIIIKKHLTGRTMPLLESLQLLYLASEDLGNLINERGPDAVPAHGRYLKIYRGLHLEAQDWRLPHGRPLTYSIIQDMVTGLKDCFWRVNYVESFVDIYRLDGSPLYMVGQGAIYEPTTPLTALNGAVPGLLVADSSNDTDKL